MKYARAELDIIKSSFGYKFMRFYSTRIDHLFPDGTKRGDFRKTVVKSVRIATSQGTRHLFRLALRKPRRRDASVSVVILTRSPPADFELSLERLRGQKGIPDPEIVVINSGTCDLGSLARRYRLKLHNISPEEFDHAKTRNLAAKNSSGEFIVFLTDDAIPAKDDLIFNMIRTLTADPSIAAVTARQIPRSDADFMYCQAMWWHYRALGITRDRVVGSKEFDALTPEQRRAICQIDDVCSCSRRDRFLRYKYEKGYAEDLGLGIRLVKDGFRIAQLFSTGVIHSHVRPSSYYLKRGFVDFKALNRLLDYQTLDFKAWSVESVHDLLDLILRLDRSLVYVIDHLQAASFCQFDIQRTFDMVENLIHNVPDDAAEARAENTDLSMILSQIAEVVQYRGGRRSHGPNLLIGNYLGALEIFREWLSNSHQDLRNIETYFVDALYKLLALQVGNVLAHYVVHTRRAGQESERIMRLDRLLSEGI